MPTKLFHKNIYHNLREMILNFELYPGSRITEGEIAERFGVSRTPVRSAIQRLEAEGYLTVKPKQGCFVRPLDIDELSDYYEVRIALEMLALELACTYMSDADIKKLIDAWDPEVQKGRTDNSEKMQARDETFHLAIASGSGNKALVKYLDDIHHKIKPIRRLDFTQSNRIDRTYEEHHQIAQYLLKRDLISAQTALRAHIQRSEQFAKGLTLVQMAQMSGKRKG